MTNAYINRGGGPLPVQFRRFIVSSVCCAAQYSRRTTHLRGFRFRFFAAGPGAPCFTWSLRPECMRGQSSHFKKVLGHLLLKEQLL